MADPPLDVETDAGPERGSGTSRWQKVVGIVGLVLILWLGIQLFGPGGGPGQHTPAGNQEQQIDQDGGGHVPPTGVPDH